MSCWERWSAYLPDRLPEIWSRWQRRCRNRPSSCDTTSSRSCCWCRRSVRPSPVSGPRGCPARGSPSRRSRTGADPSRVRSGRVAAGRSRCPRTSASLERSESIGRWRKCGRSFRNARDGRTVDERRRTVIRVRCVCIRRTCAFSRSARRVTSVGNFRLINTSG